MQQSSFPRGRAAGSDWRAATGAGHATRAYSREHTAASLGVGGGSLASVGTPHEPARSSCGLAAWRTNWSKDEELVQARQTAHGLAGELQRVTLQVAALEAGLTKYKEEVEDIANSAVKELQVEEKLSAIRQIEDGRIGSAGGAL